MEDVNISKFRAQVVRSGSTPASPGFVVSVGQNPVDPSGSSQNHLPVTIATAATGLSITESQILSGAGTVGQYIRGDGSLADFPATTGGGSSVSYYLNGSVSQGTIGGVAYLELNKMPVFGAGTDISISADGYIASFITDAGDPNKLLIPAGNWNLETYFSASSSGGTPSFYVELYKYNGTTFTLIASSSTAPELIAFGTNLNPYFSTLAVPETVLALTDRLALRYYVTHSGRTITLHTENNHLCQVITTFTTGLTALNGLTSQVQFFAVGTSGTDFAISSASDTHTFNLPTASATNRGALSSADWTTFNNKTSNLGTVTSVGLSSATSGVTIGSTPITTSGTITLAIATASGSQNGLLSSTDWSTFNNKQNALTNPVTGTGTTNYLPKFTGSTTVGNSQIFDNGTSVGIGTNSLKTVSSGFTLTIGDGSTQVQPYIALSRNSLGGFWAGIRWYDGDNIKSVIQEDSDFNLRISTSANERMRIWASSGNVNIGPTPASDAGFKLDVNGTGRFSGSVSIIHNGNSPLLISTSSTTLFTTYRSNSVVVGYIGNGDGIVTSGGATNFGIRAENDLIFTSGGNNRRVTITSAGDLIFKGRSTTTNYEAVFYNDNSQLAINATNTNVGKEINFNHRNDITAVRITSTGELLAGGTTDNGAYNLQCNGTGVWGAGAYVNGSDRNIKDNISTIEKGLEYIEKMNPVRFKYKPNYTRDHKMQTGFIAQELQEVFANEDYLGGLVQNGVHLSVAYQNLLPILVKAIQELKQEIDTLKN